MKIVGKHTQQVCEQIVESFKNPESLPSALATIFLPYGDVPCRKWSFNNQLILAVSGTKDARGYRQWQSVGRQVKQGAKAVWILIPLVRKRIEQDAQTGADKESSYVYGFKSRPVFRYEDTEGEPLDFMQEQEQFLNALPLRNVAQAWGLSTEVDDTAQVGALALYCSGASAIVLGVSNLRAWAHELTHAADDRLGTLKTSSRTIKEVVADLGGAVLLSMLGEDEQADLGSVYRYCKRYADEEGKDVGQVCMSVVNRVCKCVDLILQTAAESCEDTTDNAEVA